MAFRAEINFNGPQKQDTQSFREDVTKDRLPTVSLVGFDTTHRGIRLLHDTTRKYLSTWWEFEVVDDGDIVILNDDPGPVIAATERQDRSHPFIILSAARGDPTIMSIASEYEHIGGFCRILYKPGGPSRLRDIMKLCVHSLDIGLSYNSPLMMSSNGDSGHRPTDPKERSASLSSIPWFNSEDTYIGPRPGMTRSLTVHPLPVARRPSPIAFDSDTPVPTKTFGSGGTILRSSVSTLDSEHRFRVLVIEDNGILRNLL